MDLDFHSNRMGRKEVHNTVKESCVKLVDREVQTANQAGENYLIKKKTSQCLHLRQRNYVTEIKAGELCEECKTRKFIWITSKGRRSHWPRGLRRRSSAARLLRLWVRIPAGAWMFVVSVVCCQVEVSATDWSLVQGSLTDCGASLCVIKKPRKRGS